MAKAHPNEPETEPVLVLSPQDCREIDRRCAEEFGLPSLVLMENAAVQITAAVLELLAETKTPCVLIVAGTGNNGGDGMATARHLVNAEVPVAVVLVGDSARLSADAAVHKKVCEKMGIRIFTAASGVRSEIQSALQHIGAGANPPGVVLDALFGTGLSRAVSGVAEDAILCMNDLAEGGAKIVSVDIPSGLDATTGEAHGVVVRADLTVTFVGIKTGMLLGAAHDHLGELVIADIGAPRMLIEQITSAGRKKRTHTPDQGNRRPNERRGI